MSQTTTTTTKTTTTTTTTKECIYLPHLSIDSDSGAGSEGLLHSGLKFASAFFSSDVAAGKLVTQNSFERTKNLSHTRTKCIVAPDTVFEVK